MNNKGYPVLSASHEQVVREFMRRHVNIALHHQSLSTSQQKEPYFKYFAFLLEKLLKSLSKWDIQAQTLLDYLQAPLQPYIDNLDAEIYDIFEFDSIKYQQYEVALTLALESFKEERVIVCYYVGSGKGLILNKLMNAAKSTGRKVKVYCLDKNPYPLQTLRRRIQKHKWGKIVQVIQTDIKHYTMPEHPDIIFSQLLGGLGDNELSPQCIQWAEKNATSETRIIPQKYTAFIRPISCHSLHRQLSKAEKQSYFAVNFGLAYSPFPSKQIWSFQHPLSKEDSLSRKAIL